MNYRDDDKRPLIGRVSDQVIADNLKPQRLRGEVRSRVPLMWKHHKLADSLQDVLTEARSSSRIILSYELPDFGDVLRCTRVKLKSLTFSHFGVLFRGAPLAEFALSAAQVFKESLTVNGLDATALDVIVAAVKDAAHFRYFSQIGGHGVLDQFVGSTTALGSQFV